MNDQYLNGLTVDITGSIHDYDYTKKSVINLNRVINSKQFEQMDSETIFQYLQTQMEVVSFGDYLRRYIYEEAQIPGSFELIREEYYISYISECFEMNRAPHSFSPVQSRWRNIIKRWLSCQSVQRDTVFLLGFGLNMTDQDVSMFLTKVIKEQDFRLNDPRETVFWYCFHHGFPYHVANSLLHEFEEMKVPIVDKSSFWTSVASSIQVYLSNRNMLEEYLAFLKTRHNDPENQVSEEFKNIFERAVIAVRQTAHEDDRDFSTGDYLTGASDIEAALCSGMPRTVSKNLVSITKSVLSAQFQKKRLSRQRLSRLLRKETEADRFDLITLLFLVYAVSEELDSPTERYLHYIDEVNAVLRRCDMWEIYPVNPYESFVLMCLLTETPLAVYNDVWEMSFLE